MSVTITTKGYIELHRNGVLLSRHSVETEAIERALADWEANGDAVYRLKFPEKEIVPRKLKIVPVPILTNEPPSAPALVGVKGATGNVSLSWSASTPASGTTVTGYNVYRNGALVTSNTSSLSASYTGLSETIAHLFQVKAVSNYGAESVASNQFTASWAYWSDGLPDTYNNIQPNTPFSYTFQATEPAGNPIPFDVTNNNAGIDVITPAQVGTTRELTIRSLAGLSADSYSVRIGLSDSGAEADYAARTAGAIRYTDFRDSEIALFNKGKVTGTAYPERVTRDTSGVALTGGACLRIDIPMSAAQDSGAWKCFLNSAWDSLSIDAAQPSVGMGSTAFYVQYRVRFPSSWLTLANGTTTGKKVSIVSSNYNSNTPFEHVIQNIDNRGIVQAYRQDGSNYPPFEEALPPFDFKLQNMVGGAPGEYCLYSGSPSFNNCYRFTPDVWMCILMRIKATTYGGSSGNEWDLWAWKPGESGYTHLQSFRNYAVGGLGGYTNGFNGVHLLPYTTGRTSASEDSYVLYDQLIVSLSPIACPTI
jgi:hypothetical protein